MPSKMFSHQRTPGSESKIGDSPIACFIPDCNLTSGPGSFGERKEDHEGTRTANNNFSQL